MKIINTQELITEHEELQKECDELRTAVRDLVAIVDEDFLPIAHTTAFDLGRLNNTLIHARPLIEAKS